MASINWTAEAQRWLKDIYDYIAADSTEAATRTITGIHAKAETLLAFPEIGHRYRADSDIRILLYGHYRIAYLIKSNQDVDILGVFHGALDIERYFGGWP